MCCWPSSRTGSDADQTSRGLAASAGSTPRPEDSGASSLQYGDWSSQRSSGVRLCSRAIPTSSFHGRRSAGSTPLYTQPRARPAPGPDVPVGGSVRTPGRPSYRRTRSCARTPAVAASSVLHGRVRASESALEPAEFYFMERGVCAAARSASRRVYEEAAGGLQERCPVPLAAGQPSTPS
eukprot:scaffold1309_cov117-Isochrysis_galbana.AAC.5